MAVVPRASMRACYGSSINVIVVSCSSKRHGPSMSFAVWLLGGVSVGALGAASVQGVIHRSQNLVDGYLVVIIRIAAEAG